MAGGKTCRGAKQLRRELESLRQKVAELEESRTRQGEIINELRESGDIFRSIAGAAVEAILVLDERGEIVYFNRAAERLFGYTAEEALGRRLHEFLVPERYRNDTGETFTARAAVGMGDMIDTVREFSALSKSGVEFPVEVSISSSRAGSKDLYITICRDVSERKRFEEELQESQRRYRELVENLNDVIFTLDPMGCFTYVSPAIEHMSHYRPEEFIGHPFTRFVHPEDLEGLLDRYERTLGGELEPYEFRVLDKDGSVLHIRTSSRPLYRNGVLAGMTGLITDISKRKRAEEELERYRADLEDLVNERTRELEEATEELRRSERYYRALIENAYDIIAVLDIDGTLGYLSPSLERVSGHTHEERIGRNAFEFFHPDELPGSIEHIIKGLEKPGSTIMVEYRWRHADGSWHWMEAVATNLLEDPAVRGIVVNARDITERKMAQDALRESEERYRSLVEASPDFISLTDISGKLLMVNQSGVNLCGY